MTWFWQKKVRGWDYSFWDSDTPLCSKRFAMLTREESAALADKVRKQRHNGERTIK